MSDVTIANSEVKWGDSVSAKLSDMPEASVVALAQRGFTHVFGNERASYVSGLKKAVNEDGSATYTEAEVSSLSDDWQTKKLAAIMDGTLGVRVGGGVRMSGIDKVMREIAIKELRAIAAAKKATLPRKSEDLNPLIEARLAKHDARIRAAAQSELDALAEVASEE